MKLPFSSERLPLIITVTLGLGASVGGFYLIVLIIVFFNSGMFADKPEKAPYLESAEVLPWQKDDETSETITVASADTTSTSSQPAVSENDPYGHLPGDEIYNTVCALCHGADGTSSPLNFMVRVPTINNPDTLAVATDEYLYDIIANGRSGSAMAPMRDIMSPATINKVVAYIRSWEDEGADVSQISSTFGKALAGREHYRMNCASCHGMEGKGGVGVALNTPKVLGEVTDLYLATTIVEGRPGTAMAGWKHLHEQTISDILAYMRSWQGDTPIPTEDTPGRIVDEVHTQKDDKGNIIYHEISDRALNVGKAQYDRHCMECHGAEGKFPPGDMTHIAPTLNNKEFLDAASDGFILATIARGRQHTPMRSFGVKGASGEAIGAQSMKDIVAYIRSWEQE